MKKHIPNFITCLNVLTGGLGLLAVIQGDMKVGIFYVIIASFFDFLDGLIARLLKVQSEFGKQLDSLADMVSFGVLPSFILFELFSKESLDWAIVALLVIPFSALRLAKFNLASDQSDEFKGLPTPANAVMIGAIAFMYEDLMNLLNKEILLVLTALSCFLLVSNIPMIALKFKSMAWKGNEQRYSLISLEVIGLAIFQLSFIPFVIPLYIAVSVVGNLLRKSFIE